MNQFTYELTLDPQDATSDPGWARRNDVSKNNSDKGAGVEFGVHHHDVRQVVSASAGAASLRY